MSDPLIQRLEYLSGGDKSFQKELIELFLSECQKNLHAVDQAIILDDLETATRAVHAIKGASLNVGAQDLSVISEHLEYQLEQGNHQPDKIKELHHQFQVTQVKLLEYVTTL